MSVPGEFRLTQSKLCLRSAGRRSAIMGIMAEDNVSGSYMAETAISSSDFEITNKDFMSFIKYTRAPKIAAALHADS